MIIKKFLHSCLLLEKDGKRLLIDPGTFSFIEGKLKPEDIGPVDVILITHNHPDHFDSDSLRRLLALRNARIVTINQIGDQLVKEGMLFEKITAGDTQEVAGFSVQMFDAPHGPIPTPLPENAAFLIDNSILHPGDSFEAHGLEHCDTLALPTSGPWARLVDAMAMVDRLKPKRIIPIHDVFMKDFMLDRMYDRVVRPQLETRGITFHPLGLGDELSI